MSDKRYRFIGIRPFETAEQDIFFEREQLTQDFIQIIDNHNVTILHSKPGMGKTSLIKAGLLPAIEKSSQFNVIYLAFPNFFKNSDASPVSVLSSKLDEYNPKTSYLDKLTKGDNSFWYKLKRMQSVSDKTILLVLDQFENIFSFSEFEVSFFSNLLEEIFDTLPERLKGEVYKNISQNSDEFTEEAKIKTLEKINVKLVISIRDDKLHKLEYFKKLQSQLYAKIPVPEFSTEQGKNVLRKTASYKPKYHIDDNFVSEPFEITDNLLSEIIEFLTKKETKGIEPYQLQIIGRELEKISINSLSTKLDTHHVSNFPDLYNDYYEAVINKISDPIQRMAARKFIEDELIFEYEHRKLTVYEGVATVKYGIKPEILDFLEKNNIINRIKNEGEVYFEISHDALITPILIAKQTRIEREILLEEELRKKKVLEEQAEKQRQRTKRNRNIAVSLSLLLIFSFVMIFLIFKQKHIAEVNEQKAKSSYFAALAFGNIETDPTKAFFYASEAYETKPENPMAVSAVLSAFHKTGVFYSNIYKPAIQYDNAIIASNLNKIAFLQYDDSQIVLTNEKGEVSKILPINGLPSAVKFSKNTEFLAVAYYDKKIEIFNLDTGKKYFFNTKYRIIAIDFLKNSKIVAAADNGKIFIYDFHGKIKKTFNFGKNLTDITVSHNNQYIAVSNTDGNIAVFDSNANKISQYDYVFEYSLQSDDFQPLEFSPDTNFLLITVNDNFHFNFQIIIWDFKHNKVIAKFKDLGSWINSSHFVGENQVLCSTKEGKIFLCDIKKSDKKILLGHTAEVFDAIKIKDKVTSVSADGTIRTWKIYNDDKKLPANIISFSKTGKYYVTVKDNRLITSNLLGKEILKITETNSYDFSDNDKFIVAKTGLKSLQIKSLESTENYKIQTDDDILDFQVYDKKIYVHILGKILIYDINGNLKNSENITEDDGFVVWNEEYLLKISDKIILKTIDGSIVFDYSQFVIKNYSIGNDYFIVQTANSILYYHKKAVEIPVKYPIEYIGTTTDGNMIYAGNSSVCTIFDTQGDKLVDFKTNYRINGVIASQTSVYLKLMKNNGKIDLIQKIISPKVILKYVNELKLYGNLYQNFAR